MADEDLRRAAALLGGFHLRLNHLCVKSNAIAAAIRHFAKRVLLWRAIARWKQAMAEANEGGDSDFLVDFITTCVKMGFQVVEVRTVIR